MAQRKSIFWWLLKLPFKLVDFTTRTFFALLLLTMTVGAAVAVSMGGQDSPPDIQSPSVLVLNPEGQLIESRVQSSPLEFFSSKANGMVSVHQLVQVIEHAATDDRIQMILLRLENLWGLNSVNIEMLGKALQKFKAEGKSSVAYGYFYEQNQYLLASYADKVLLHPMGAVLIRGFGRYQNYFYEMLEKLGIKVHLFRAGTHKSAAEPLVRSNMSEEEKASSQTIINAFWQVYAKTMASNRGLQESNLNQFIQQPEHFLSQAEGDTARMSMHLGWVDDLMTDHELDNYIEGQFTEDDDVFPVNYKDYAKLSIPGEDEGDDFASMLGYGQDNIGLIIAEGTIVDSQPDSAEIVVAADDLVSLIKQAREDSRIKALVIRLSTPGGSAVASERIREALNLFQAANKPVVISMANVAASGGYWLAANADEIWALPTTITGSIGVFTLIPTFEGAAQKIGVGTDGVNVGTLSSITLTQPLPNALTDILQMNVKHLYQRFVGLVAEGRELPLQKVRQIAEGKVWTGEAALEHQLVDHLGGLDDAIKASARLAGLDEWQVRPLLIPYPWWRNFSFPLFSANQQLASLQQFLLGWMPEASLLRMLDEPRQVQALCLDCSFDVPLQKAR